MVFLISLRLSSDTEKIRGLSFVFCAQEHVLPRIPKLKELFLHLLTNKFDVDFLSRVGGWVGRVKTFYSRLVIISLLKLCLTTGKCYWQLSLLHRHPYGLSRRSVTMLQSVTKPAVYT